jgi:hypothetical protein
MRNFISPIISEKKPTLLKEDHRRLALFIDHFYQFLEEQGNPLEVLENFLYNTEPNNQVDVYIDKILFDLGFNIQKTLTIPKKELILHLKQFYLSRGSEASFKFIFKLVYGSDLKIGYPRTSMLSPSQATYSGRNFIFVTANNRDTSLFERITTEIPRYGVRIHGVASKGDAGVESFSLVYTSHQVYLKIQIDNPHQTFQKGEGVEITSQLTNEKMIENFVDTCEFEIIDPGFGYHVGDQLNVSNYQVPGQAFVKTTISGSISDLQINDGGVNYAVGDTIQTSQLSKGHSFSAVVSRVDTSNNYLSIPNHTSLNLNTGNFTVEMWVNPGHSIEDMVLCSNKSPNANNGWTLKLDANHRLHFQLFGMVTTTTFSTRSVRYKWSHIAVAREGNTIRLFIDGTQVSDDVATNGTASTQSLRIGLGTNSKSRFIGHIQDIRITKGVARYTERFTVPTAPFDDTDSLFNDITLWIRNGGLDTTNFFDGSSLAHTVTNNGSVFVTNNNTLFKMNTCQFTGWGPIQSISIYNHGYDYDTVPQIIIQSKQGTGADLEPLSYDIGQIGSIEIIEPYIDSIGPPTTTVTSTGGSNAVITAKVGSIFKERPSWKSFEGMLGISATLLDSYYYQQFSYYTYSTIPRRRSDPIIDEWCHPAGFVRFAILDISFSDTLNQSVSYDHKFSIIFRRLIFSGDASIQFLNQAFDIYPIIKYITLYDSDVLVNPQSRLDWYKESVDNYTYNSSYWDDMTVGDPPLGTTDVGLLSRKRINDDSIPMNEALDSEIEIIVL